MNAIPKEKLSDYVAKNRPVPDGKPNYIVWDSKVVGFGLRIGATSRVWILYYRNSAGKQRKMRLGAFPSLGAENARKVAQAAIELGFYISFSGIVTFKNDKLLKEVARRVPLENMLIETDAPYLAPMPHRGKTNQPGYVRHVAEEIARLKGVPLDQIAGSTTENFFKLFNVTRKI